MIRIHVSIEVLTPNNMRKNTSYALCIPMQYADLVSNVWKSWIPHKWPISRKREYQVVLRLQKKTAIAVTCLSSLKPSQTANSRGAVVCAAYPWIQTMGSILKSRKCSLTSQSLQERRPPTSPIPTLGQLCEL